MRADVRGLVASRRLVFLNGAFSMHDEAAPTYIDMLDNLATGHRSIASEFGVQALPTVRAHAPTHFACAPCVSLSEPLARAPRRRSPGRLTLLGTA